jgi:hypothetical protein
MGQGGIKPIGRCSADLCPWLTSSKPCHLRYASSSTPEALSGSNPNLPRQRPKQKSHLRTRPCEHVLFQQQESHTELPLYLFVSRFVIEEELFARVGVNNAYAVRYGSILTISLYGIPVIL